MLLLLLLLWFLSTLKQNYTLTRILIKDQALFKKQLTMHLFGHPFVCRENKLAIRQRVRSSLLFILPTACFNIYSGCSDSVSLAHIVINRNHWNCNLMCCCCKPVLRQTDESLLLFSAFRHRSWFFLFFFLIRESTRWLLILIRL